MILAQDILSGSRLALARLLTQIENDTPQGRLGLDELFPFTGRAHLIGVTGAPGTGKSSLVNRLAFHYRHSSAGGDTAAACRVGIVAVDPSSPFSGGAILGDRVRMRDLAGDPGVFIRSMATRGSLGGLAAATAGVVQALDAAGFDVILIETVGAGQAEVDIARLAHTTLVVEAPGLGDDIQAIKAGILEIADVLVINKADRPGVESAERALRSMLQLGHPAAHIFQEYVSKPGHGLANETISRRDGIPVQSEIARSETGMDAAASFWLPPILRTVATEGQGIAELAQAVEDHHAFLQQSGELAQRERDLLRSELDLLLRETLVARWRARLPAEAYEAVVERLAQRQVSPWRAVEELLGVSTL
jgi:LAO/AO transport system kinase